MDRQKMMDQAKILRDKKLARMAQMVRQLRPKVENGVVKYDHPQVQKSVQQFAAPSTARVARSVLPQSQNVPPKEVRQPLSSQTVARLSQGCSSCRRKSG